MAWAQVMIIIVIKVLKLFIRFLLVFFHLINCNLQRKMEFFEVYSLDKLDEARGVHRVVIVYL